MNTTSNSLWVGYALLSAVFAALTSILAKLGISGIDSNLATAIRTVVVLVMAWGIVFMTGVNKQLPNIGARSWIFFDSFRNRDRTVLAVLLPCAPAGRCQQGGAD